MIRPIVFFRMFRLLRSFGKPFTECLESALFFESHTRKNPEFWDLFSRAYEQIEATRETHIGSAPSE